MSFAPKPIEVFQEFLRSVQNLSGLNVCVHDVAGFTKDGGEQIEEALCVHYSKFCQIIKATRAGQGACVDSDGKVADKKAGELGRPFLHRCHAGLTEVVVPIMQGGRHLGTIFCGQSVIKGLRESRFDAIAGNVRHLVADMKGLRAAFRKVPKVSKDKLEHAGKLLNIAANYLVDVSRKMAVQKAIEDERNRPVAEAMRIIDRRFNEDLKVPEISRHVALSPSYFSRTFRRATGMTFVDFLTMRRIEEAKNLLLGTRMKIIDIAYQVGYADQSYFNKRFRERTGLTPSQFRSRA
jgi:AraC-like DNA-binding protein/ligand-binding sensor protein